MSRIVFWVALIVLIGFAVRAKLRAAILKSQQQMAARATPAAPPASVESMTSCAHCGLYFPVSEAVHADGQDYCSPAHAHLPPR